MDNGAFHKAKTFIITTNIALIFLQPYSLELNPAENIWAILKRKFTNKLHHSLEEVSDFIKNVIEDLSTSRIKSVGGFEYVFAGLNWNYYTAQGTKP